MSTRSLRNATLLVLTANRGLCGGYNGNVQRAGFHRWLELQQTVPKLPAGNRRQARHRGVQVPRHHGRRDATRISTTSRRSTKST